MIVALLSYTRCMVRSVTFAAGSSNPACYDAMGEEGIIDLEQARTLTHNNGIGKKNNAMRE